MDKNRQKEEKVYKHGRKLTMARYDYTLIEMRIMMSLIYLMDQQHTLKTDEYSDHIGYIADSEYQQKTVRFPIKTILGDDYKPGKKSDNYALARKSMQSLSKKPISFYTSDDCWKDYYPFVMVEKKAGESSLTAVIAPQVWKLLRNISGGYTLLKIDNMMLMKSKYTIRMHQIIEGMKRPLTFRIKTMKEMFKAENKYKKNNDFITNVLDKSKDELHRMNLTTFDYRKESRKEEKGKGRPETTHITLIPIYSDNPNDLTIQKIARTKGISALLTEEETIALLHAGFRPPEIKANITDIYRFARMNDLPTEIQIMLAETKDKENPKGWIISEIRRINDLLNKAAKDNLKKTKQPQNAPNNSL